MVKNNLDVSGNLNINNNLNIINRVSIGTDKPSEASNTTDTYKLLVYDNTNTNGSFIRIESDTGINGIPSGIEFINSAYKSDDPSANETYSSGRIISKWPAGANGSYSESIVQIQNAKSVGPPSGWVDALTCRNGNVGIGTNNPQQLLDVMGGEIIARFRSTSDSLVMVETSAGSNREVGYVIKRGDGLGYWGMITDDDANLHFAHSSSDYDFSGETKMKIMTDGTIDIGGTLTTGSINTGSGSITTTGQGSFGSIHTNTFQGANNTDNKILSTTDALKIQGEVGFITIRKITNNSHLLMNTTSDDAYIYLTQLNNTAYWDCASGKTNQSVEWRFRNASRSYAFGYLAQSSTGVLTTNFAYTSSDDRLKINEELIEDATTTIMKLRPQKYDKYTYLESEINNFVGEQKPQINQLTHEFGFIAQEIYYEIPELRKLISVPASATLIDDNKNMNFEDIKNDPDYSNWGDEKALVHYNSFIPLLTKGFQELHTKIKSQQIADKERITNLETKVNILETENQQQQTKMNELTSIIDKLKTANSFEEFKQTF